MKQSLQGIEVVLLDIEGTICPITFVKETLFPYALSALPEVLKTEWSSSSFDPYKSAFPTSAQQSPEALLSYVQDLTARDVKVACLKNLQGYLWQTGYKSHAYSTPLFDDVLPALKSYKSSGKRISIYSSGSIFAQKLLFAHVKDQESSDPKAIVDCTSLVEDEDVKGGSWFDTTNAGSKTEVGSYEVIVRELGVKEAGRVLFLSDNVKEVSAALKAGMKSVVVDRPGNAPLTTTDRETYDIVTSLSQLQLS